MNGFYVGGSTDRKRLRWLTPEEAERLIEAAAALTLPRHTAPETYTLAKIAFLLGLVRRTAPFAGCACQSERSSCWGISRSRGGCSGHHTAKKSS